MRMVEDRGASGSVAGLLGTLAEHDLVIASFSRFLGARGCSPNTPRRPSRWTRTT